MKESLSFYVELVAFSLNGEPLEAHLLTYTWLTSQYQYVCIYEKVKRSCIVKVYLPLAAWMNNTSNFDYNIVSLDCANTYTQNHSGEENGPSISHRLLEW